MPAVAAALRMLCSVVAITSPAAAAAPCPQHDLIEFSFVKGSASRSVSLPRNLATYRDIVPGSARRSFTASISIAAYIERGTMEPSSGLIGRDTLQIVAQNLPDNAWAFDRFLEFHFRANDPSKPVKVEPSGYGLMSAVDGTELNWSKLYTDNNREVFIICTDPWQNGGGYCFQNVHGAFLSARVHYHREHLRYWEEFQRFFADFEVCVLR